MTYAEKFNTSLTCANSEGIKRSITVSIHADFCQNITFCVTAAVVPPDRSPDRGRGGNASAMPATMAAQNEQM